ncbi:MAG: SPFH domain-containing protein [Nocardiopsaceae bacterium]|nr:SPFH domain-containing protein [Nocardiopsaceae bacterium]
MSSLPLRGSALITAALLVTGCSVSTNPDEAGLEYNAGLFSSTTFDNCVEPGNREYYGPGDEAFVYPAGQRTFPFSGSEDAFYPAATVVSNDDLELTVTGLATFSLNIECDVLQEFHERIGIKYDADTEEGWAKMLREYIGEPLHRALDDATKEYAWRDLYTSGETKAEWEKTVGELTADYIEEQGGGAFFCSPTFTGAEDEKCGAPQLTLQQPTPPEDVRNALTKAQKAIEETRAQEEENKRVDKELEAIEELVDVLGPEGYILYEAIKNGDIDVIPVPSDGSLNITPEEN